MKELLKQIIKENEETDFRPIKRDIEIFNIDKIICLIGPRRVGKTYLLYEKINELKRKNSYFLFINFEDERLINFKIENFNEILDSYFELYPEARKKRINLFFDEIQYIPNWELFIKRIYETKKYNIFVTGSSSKLLSREISTSLRGRSYPLYIFPLSFREFLNFKNLSIEKNFFYSDKRHLIKSLFLEYLDYGGFPEISNITHKREIIKTYLDLTIYKDLVDRYKIRNTFVLNYLIHMLITNVSKEFSINSCYKVLKNDMKVSRDTIIEYVSFLEDINLIFFVKKFNYSLKNQELSNKKVYLIDNGFKSLVSFKFNEDFGRQLENIVFMHYKRKSIYEIFYHKKKFECDFLLKEKDKIVKAVQVTKSLNYENEKREIMGLVEAALEYNLKEGLLLTYEDEERDFVKDKIKIKVRQIWKYLLE